MAKKSSKYLRKFLYWRYTRNTIHLSRLIVLPGFQGVPVFDVLSFFFNGLYEGYISQRAAALAYHFILATFPLLLFFFTLIPYIPIDALYFQVIDLIQLMVPDAIAGKVIHTINEIFLIKHQGLMSIGFISSLYVGSSGMHAMIESFKRSTHGSKKRPWYKDRLISIGLLFAVGLVALLSFTLIIGSESFFNFLLTNGVIEEGFMVLLLQTAKWLLLIALVYIMFVVLYYYSPADKSNFRFFSAGATLATILFLLSVYGFDFYITHFSKYNALYGSIGALIIFFLWFYLVSFILIIGFELNASIAHAISDGHRREKRVYDDINNEEEPLHISRTGGNKSSFRRWKKIVKENKISFNKDKKTDNK